MSVRHDARDDRPGTDATGRPASPRNTRRRQRSGRPLRLSAEPLEQRLALTGDTLATATALGTLVSTLGRSDQISPSTDVDVYSFRVQAGQRVAFDIDRPAGSSLDSFIRLFNASGTELQANDDGPNPAEGPSLESYMEYTFSRAGTYYVGVSAFANNRYSATTAGGKVATASTSGTGRYSLVLSNVNVDPDDQISEAIALGSISELRFNWTTIDSPTDVDVYRFDVTAANRRLQFDIDRQVPQLDSVIRLFDAGGRQLAANDDGPNPAEERSSESYLDYTFARPGTYYVAVSGFGNTAYNPRTGLGDSSGSTGDYMLRVSPADSDPDDAIDQAAPLGAITATRQSSGRIDPADDVDMFSFTVAAGQRIAFDIDNPAGGTLDSFLRCFDGRGNEIGRNDDGPAPDEPASNESYLALTFSVAGTYYVGVSGFGNATYNPSTGGDDRPGSTGGYTLTLSEVDADPDDTIASATALGPLSGPQTRTGTIDLNGTDVDLYSVTVSAGQRVGFDIDRAGTRTLDSYLRLFDASGRELQANDDGPTPTEPASSESYIEFTFTAAGTYYLGVSGFGNAGYRPLDGGGDVMGSSGDYTLVVTPLSAANDDPDDQISEAVVLGDLGMPRSYTAGFRTRTDVDMLAFTVTAGQRVFFDVDVTAGAGFDPFLRLFDAAGTQLAADDDGPNPDEPGGASVEPYIAYTFPTAGTYYAGVSSFPNTTYDPVTGGGDVAGTVGSYRLVVTPAAMTQGDADDQISEAIALGAAAAGVSRGGTIDIAPDVDMYAFTVAAGSTLWFDIDRPAGGTLDSFLRLFDAAGVELASNDDGPTPTEPASVESYLQFTFGAAGTYYVGVSGFGNGAYSAIDGTGDTLGSTGDYTLVIGGMANDPDDTIAEANPLGAIGGTRTVGGVIDEPTDVDLVSFTVVAGQMVSFDIDLPPGGGLDAFLRLFDSAGTPLAANDNGPTAGEPASNEPSLVRTFVTGGTYFVGISGSPNSAYNAVSGAGDMAGSTGAYTLVIDPLASGDSDPDDQIAEAARLGTIGATQSLTVSGAIDGVTDVDMVAFTVAAGQKITFDIDRPAGSTLDSCVRLFDATGRQLAVDDDGPNPSEPQSVESFLDFTFTTAGTYYLGVSGYANLGYDPVAGVGDVSGSTGGYTLVITSSAGMAPPQPGSGFNIALSFSGLTPSQQAIFDQAAARWSQIIVGDLPDVTVNGRLVDDVFITASAVPIDGVSGILGQAGPQTFRSGSQLPSTGFMQFDSADLANLESNGKLLPVILHEMGHVLGIGTIWAARGLLTGAGTTNPRFTGQQATAAYNAIFGRNDTSVPVEGLPSPPGSRDGHFRESVFGPELMSPFISFSDTSSPISRVTVASLADLSYQVNINAADRFTPPPAASGFLTAGGSGGGAGDWEAISMAARTSAFAGLADAQPRPAATRKPAVQPSAGLFAAVGTAAPSAPEAGAGRPAGLYGRPRATLPR